MTIPLEMRDLARCLLVYEANTGATSESMEPATIRVYENLRLRLGELAGVAAFESLASRALILAKAEVPNLSKVRVSADGSLQGLMTFSSQTEMVKNRAGEFNVGEGEIVLIASLLGLLHIFIGEALTVTLLRDAWPVEAFGDWNSGNGGES